MYIDNLKTHLTVQYRESCPFFEYKTEFYNALQFFDPLLSINLDLKSFICLKANNNVLGRVARTDSLELTNEKLPRELINNFRHFVSKQCE